VFTVAGVTGVFMTLSLILMVSSATELIRYECDHFYRVFSFMSGWVAAFVRSHMNGSIPFDRTIE